MTATCFGVEATETTETTETTKVSSEVSEVSDPYTQMPKHSFNNEEAFTSLDDATALIDTLRSMKKNYLFKGILKNVKRDRMQRIESGDLLWYVAYNN